MPRLDLNALERVMRRRNFLFKHQLANLVGISYERLTRIIVHGESDVDEEIVARLCSGLGCKREDIIDADSA